MKALVKTAVSPLSVQNIPSFAVFQRRFHGNLHKVRFWVFFLALALLGSRAAYATTYTVTDTSDTASDTASLRYAVNTATDGDVIDFSGVIGTITLTNGTLTISHSVTITGPGANLLTISGNNATPVFEVYAPGTVNISGLTIANGNNANNGGGIDHIYTAGTLAVSDCTFAGNTTAAGGGAIANGGVLAVSNSTFIYNTAGSGGAAAGVFNNGGTATIESSTFYGNSSPVGPGGGIFNNGTMTVNNSTVTGNTGDGIFNNGGQPLTVTNSIVANNTGGDCDQCGTQGANNLIGGASGLGPLQYNGGTTKTMMPLPGSPAIGAGSGSGLTTDQRGFARARGGSSDLGAVSTNYLTVANLDDSGTGSLRAAITTANSDGSGDIIFQSGLTGAITLGSTLPSIITSQVNIVGPGANLLTVSGGGPTSNYEVLDISGTGPVVNLSGLTIANGNVLSGFAAGLSNSGLLTVENVALSYNDGDNGGAIFNDGTLVIENSTFSSNAATEGAGIANQRTLLVANSTFYSNGAYNGTGGGGIENNGGAAVVADSTFYKNYAVNGAVGGGIDNSSGNLTVTNSIVSGSTGGGDCNCGTQSAANLIGGTPNFGPLQLNGLNATVQTMLPLPGSPAIQIGDPTQLPAGLTTDERGFPRTTGGKLDVGAAQTNYTSIQFVQQPTNAVFNTTITPAVTVEVLETNAGSNTIDAVSGIPITLTFSGSGTLGGTLTETTTGGVASFGDLNVNIIGSGNTLGTSLTVTPTGVSPAQILTNTSVPFDITLPMPTVNFNPPLPAGVTYGVSPLTLKANANFSGAPTGQALSFQVDSGPAMVSGNVLTITGAGTVVVEVDAAANGTYEAGDATASIAVAQAASSLALTSSSMQVAPGSPVTLTATATSLASGTPTGSVIFSSGGIQLGTSVLSGGIATMSVTTLPSGTNGVTASYAGDTNFTGSTAQLAGGIVVGTPTFSITSSVSSMVIQRGQVGTATLTLTPMYGYTGTVSFGCNGLPAQSVCNFGPQSITFDGSGNPVQVSLVVEIGQLGLARKSGMARLESVHPLRSLPLLPAMIFWLPGAELAVEERERQKQRKSKKKSGRVLLMMALLAVTAGVWGLAGCSGMKPNSGPPAGQQTVTITAAGSGNISQSIAVQVNVQ